MTYHTYQDEQLAERCDELTRKCCYLISLLTNARSVEQLAKDPVVTAFTMLSGHSHRHVHAIPVIDGLRHAMDLVNDEIEKMESHLLEVRHEVCRTLDYSTKDKS
jgi:Ni,Fe-hydrogenase III large subunit